MCSNAGYGARAGTESGLAARLAAEIDAIATAADADAASPDVTSRLARAWAMITAADPDLAARTAAYRGS
jgi:hypothetical protein